MPECDMISTTLKRSSVVIITGNRHKTGQQFVDTVYTLAIGLLKLGLRNGDVVAISAFNSDWYLEWILAVAYVGGILAPLNYRWSFNEARLAMLSIRPVMLVTDESCSYWSSELQSNDVPSLRWHVSLDSPSSDFVSLFNVSTTERSSILDYSWAPDGAVIICFTSGTTGRPKGVVISHEALIVQSLAKIAIVGYSEDDVYLHTAPLCHISGLSSAISMLMVGACHVLIPKFEAKSALEAIEQHCVTSLITVPAMMTDLVSLIREKETWKGRYCLRKILNGGGGMSKVLLQEAINIFPKAKLVSAYGMTETTSSLSFMTLYSPTENSSELILPTDKSNQLSHLQGVCVGKPAPHVEIKTCSDGTSEAGRILTRGPHVMLRYWDQVDAESGKDFWLDTGDFGSIDQYGNIWLVGRTNFRIKSGGENVYHVHVLCSR
ncbi:hypothetical protein ACFE04_029313 [Oxalis oulophora]